MCSYNDKETLSTLRFGNRAKTIKNKIVQNKELRYRILLIYIKILSLYFYSKNSAKELKHLLE
jgi:hypothetical protein